MPGRTVWARLIVFVGVAGVAVVAAALVGLPDVERLRADIAAAGPVAPVLFVLVYAAAGPHLVALVRAGATFVNGKLVERPDDHHQPEAA